MRERFVKIISAWRDYYDSMQCYANPAFCSNDFTYIRKTKAFILFDELSRAALSHHSDKHSKHDIQKHIIGFCGQWYFMYAIKTSDKYFNEQNLYLNYTFFSSIKDALLYVWNVKRIKKEYVSNTFPSNSVFQKYKRTSFNETLDKVLTYYVKRENEKLFKLSNHLNGLNLFEEHNTPTIQIKSAGYSPRVTRTLRFNDVEVIVNPSLEKVAFFKKIDSNIAYQKIETFLGNELLPKDNAAQITDNLVLAGNHGFDKMSFRKSPTKVSKRIKRKANKTRKQK